MRWPPWSSDASEDVRKKKVDWQNTLNATDWTHYTSPQTIIPTVLLTGTTLALVRLWRMYLRRIPGAGHVQPGFFRKRSLFGTVTRVGDGDNFHLYHTPGGRLAGWGWLRKVPTKPADLKGKTIPVRIAGIDAPEAAHFGKEAQPYSGEALEWLRKYILGRRVRAYIYKRDQYNRIVASVYVRRGLLRKDVGQQMLKAGMASVYEAKFGSEFGMKEDKYRAVEAAARAKKVGLWASAGKDYESPRDYKTRTANMGEKVQNTVAEEPLTGFWSKLFGGGSSKPKMKA